LQAAFKQCIAIWSCQELVVTLHNSCKPHQGSYSKLHCLLKPNHLVTTDTLLGPTMTLTVSTRDTYTVLLSYSSWQADCSPVGSTVTQGKQHTHRTTTQHTHNQTHTTQLILISR
jgi:hypothetical protein